MTPQHRTYLEQLVEVFGGDSVESKDSLQRLEPYIEAVLEILMLDLGQADGALSSLYAKRKGGKPARNPLAMLRCLILMSILGETKINAWVRRLRKEPILSILSGFSSDDRPGVGTFYDFFNRLLDGEWKKPCEHNKRASALFRGTRGRFRRNLKKEKEETKKLTQAELAQENETPVKQAVEKVLGTLDQVLPKDALNRVEEILFRCAVVPSYELGLLGLSNIIDVAGDGSYLESQADGNGTSFCQCDKETATIEENEKKEKAKGKKKNKNKKGKKRCDCDRYYSDPDACWGWDSYNKTFYFGHRLHALVTKNGAIELPLHIMVAGANSADVIMAIEAMMRMRKLMGLYLPELKLGKSIFDAGYDATEFHRFIIELCSMPVIALNPRSAKVHDDLGNRRDEQGRPLCPAGIPMRSHGFDKKRQVSVFNCPAKRPGRINGKPCFKTHIELCPLGCLCDPNSVMGPMLKLSAKDDPRLNPVIPRGSEAWKEAYNKRTCTERFNSFVKEAGGLGKAPYRRRHIFLFMTLCHSLRRHAMEWVKLRFGKSLPKTGAEVLEVMRSLLKEGSSQALAA